MMLRRSCRLSVVLCVVVTSAAIGQVLPRATVTRDLLIDGTLHTFAAVEWVRADTTGRIYVAQPADQNVCVFDAQGAPAATIGRRGDGPGEFSRLPSSRAGFFGDSLWVHEVFVRRLNVFTPAGLPGSRASVGSVKKTKIEGREPPVFFDEHVLARFADRTYALDVNYPPGRPSPKGWDDARRPIVRVTEKGEVRGVIAWLPRYEDRVDDIARGGGTIFTLPFANPTQYAVSVDGRHLMIARGEIRGPNAGFVVVTRLTMAGDTVYSRRFPAAMTPLPRAVADSAFEAEARSWDRRGLTALAARVRAAPRPDFYPALKGATIARDGSVLLAFATGGEDRDYLAIDDGGRARAFLRLPRGATVHQFETSVLWATVPDADGVESVARYRITVP
jgi:hypothetical protein